MARKPTPPTPHNRAGIWYLVRRVPLEFAALDPRGLVRVSTDIRVADDPRQIRALPAVRQANAELEAYWRGLRDGQGAEALRRFKEAQTRARSMRLDYQTAASLAAGPLDEVLKRVQILVDRGDVENEVDVAAVLGGEEKPALRLSGLFDRYEELTALKLRQHSPNQRRKWGGKFKRAIASLLAVLDDDKRLVALTRADAIKFRLFWQERIVAEDLDIGTANKQMGHLNTMLTEVEMADQLGILPVFAEIRIPGEIKKQRSSFAPDFVQGKILARGALDRLNPEARAILWIEADTGARPVEIANLLPETIFLDAPVPFIRVQAIDRVLKTVQSERDIPLVGRRWRR